VNGEAPHNAAFAGKEEFTWSAVGTREDGELVNCYWHIWAGCREYARRWAVQCFRQVFPGGRILMADAAPLVRGNERLVSDKP
jgi:hypothetical protein